MLLHSAVPGMCPVRGKCALFCRDGSVAHGTRHFAKTSEITICDAHWRHNMSQHVTRCHQERRTLHWEWHCSHFLGWPDCQDETLFHLYKAFHFISIDLNGLCPDVPSVQKRRLFWRADWHPASAEKNRQNLPGTRNSYNWVSRTQSTQERNISKLDWSRIKILLRQY
jgi:4-alpha-glucanotransferase